MDEYKKINRVNKMQNKINYKILASLLLLNQSFTYAVNQKFADTPLNLQNKSTISTAYKVKPNITLYIDDSGSMSGDRIRNVKITLNDIINTYKDNFYFSLQPMNNYSGSYYQQFFEGSDPNGLQQLNTGVSKLRANGSTPTTSRLFAIARNTVMNRLKYRCQKSYLILLSDGEPYPRWDPPITDARFDGYFDGSKRDDNYLKRANTLYMLQYYTDTLRTKSFGNFIYSSPVSYDHGFRFQNNVQRKLLDDAGQPWNSPDPLAHLPGHSPTFTQTATTFTIGYGLGSDSSFGNQYLKFGASPKPDYDPVTNPNSRYFFNANSHQQVMDAFKNIFQEIQGQTSTAMQDVVVTAPTLGESSTKLQNLIIKARIETDSWSSQLCFHNLKETAEQSKSCNKQPSFNNRKLVLNDGQNSYLYTLSTSSLPNLNNQAFKIPDNYNLNQKEWLDGLLKWFSRNSNEFDKPYNFVLDYRKRNQKADYGPTRNIGDIINNPIETIGDSEYNKQKYLITSANDGMVYVFRAANNDNNPYDLKFNYMPMAIERDSTDGTDLVRHYYKDLTSNKYGKDPDHPHRYLLNGGFTVTQTPNFPNKPKQIFMVSNMGQAGRGAFAINIGGQDLVTKSPIAAENINSANWYKDLFLFQTPSGPNNLFGYTIGTPKVAITRVNRTQNASKTSYNDHLREAAFINNGLDYPGINSENNESALYIYDVLGVDVGTNGFQRIDDAKGTLIRKLTASDGKGGLATPTVYDIDDDGVADLVYAGDYKGNLYRFDIRDPHPNNWKVKKIFTATGPITAAPALFKPDYNANDSRISHKVIVVFGTGSDLYQNDLTKKDQQAIYGIYDDHDDDNSTVINKNQLLQQFMTYSADGRTGELSNKPFSSAQYKGWYFNLNTDGERVVTSFDQLLTTGIVITRAYGLHVSNTNNTSSNSSTQDPCQSTTTTETSSSLSRLTQFDARSGGALDPNKSPYIQLDSEPLHNSISMSGLVGIRISTEFEYNNFKAGVSGNQKVPGSPPTNKNCFRKEPVPSMTNDSVAGSKNIPSCAITFKSLGWHEIKTGYFN